MSLLKSLFDRKNERAAPISIDDGVTRYALNTGQCIRLRDLDPILKLAEILAPVVRSGGSKIQPLHVPYEMGVIRKSGWGIFHITGIEVDLPEVGKQRSIPLVLGVAAWTEAAEAEAWSHVERNAIDEHHERPMIFQTAEKLTKPDTLPWVTMLATPGLYLSADGVREMDRVLNIGFSLGIATILG
jgi:hypothetical protein